MLLNRLILLVLNFLLIVNFCQSASILKQSISCKNENGEPVDWFSLYKLPKTKKHSNPLVQNGTAYIYMSNKNETWTLSSKSLGDISSFPGKSIEVLYNTNFNNNSNLGYVLYNDQALNEDDKSITNSRKAHAKGVIIFDDQTVLWIVHSIPYYPLRPTTSPYGLDDSETVYAQSMICLSLPIDSIDKIGKQLLYAYPQVYDFFIPQALSTKLGNKLSNLINVTNNKHVDTAPWFNIERLTTLGNRNFTAFHKYSKFNDDLYSGLVATNLSSKFLTETWEHGVGTMASDCSRTYPVYNIKEIQFNAADGLTMSVMSDHSKWTLNIPNKNDSKYVCIGDINRQTSQAKRGGGTVCFMNNTNVWKSYYDLVQLVENCQSENVAPNVL